MKFKLFITGLCVLCFAAGCATIPYGKEILSFEIKPDSGIKPGTIMRVTVKTTAVVKEVWGYMDVMGSPRIPLKYNKKKGVWTFKYMIPMTTQVPKGEFTAKVEAVTETGEKYQAEKKISTY